LDAPLKAIAERIIGEVTKLVEEYRLSEALVKIFDLLRQGNAYVNRTAPWKEENPEPELYNALEIVRIATTLLHPVMPSVTTRVARALGFELVKLGDLRYGGVEKFHVNEAPILFKKIKRKQVHA